MGSTICVKRVISYTIENNYICIKTPYGDHIANSSGKIIIDCLYNGVSIDDVIKQYQERKNIEYISAAIDVCEYLSSLKLIGLIEFDNNYIDTVLSAKRFNIAGEKEYQIVSNAIIEKLNRANCTWFSSYSDKNAYNAYLLRSKGFSHQELYFFSRDEQRIVSIVGIANLSERGVPANIILMQTEDENDLRVLFSNIESELMRLNKHKIRAVFPTNIDRRFMELIKKANYFQEGKLIREDRMNDYFVFSKLLLEV